MWRGVLAPGGIPEDARKTLEEALAISKEAVANELGSEMDILLVGILIAALLIGIIDLAILGATFTSTRRLIELSGATAGGVVFATLLPEMQISIGGNVIDSFWIGSVLVVGLTGLYTVLGGSRFRVCGTFDEPRREPDDIAWDHPPGRHCFVFDALSPIR
jgi:hypothetical protein